MVRTSKANSRKKAAPKTSAARFAWNGINISVRHQRDYISKGWDHIELRVVAPKGAILPITTTGYLSHFLDPRELKAADGASAFFKAWLDRESKSKKWREADAKSRQLDLFKSGGGSK